MSEQMSSMRCVNCGAALDLPADGTSVIRCPVCHFATDLSELAEPLPVTADALAAQLGTLMAQARAGGLASEEIVRVLRDELEFAAELAHTGRNMMVQIIDLGPADGQRAVPASRNRSAVLRGRAVGV